MRRWPRRPGPGFTLIELAMVLAVAALLVTLALPAFTAPVAQARRGDAVAALTRVQMAQEQFRAQHGIYAADPQALNGVAMRSEAGHYELQLMRSDPLTYEAVASARADGAQAQDADCLQITLRVSDGLAEFGPSARCWGR